MTDFAVTREPDGRLAPRLIELQAFPTLYAFQAVQCEELARVTPGGEQLGWYLSGLDAEGYRRTMGEAILSGLPPDEVVLLDLDPPRQKTAIDFAFTEQFWDVRAVDPRAIEKVGRELWYERDGKRKRIRRIYNRLIFDELAATGIEAALRPHLAHRRLLGGASQLVLPLEQALPARSCAIRRSPRRTSSRTCASRRPDLENWVLKPLFSFAGSGVKVEVTRRGPRGGARGAARRTRS